VAHSRQHHHNRVPHLRDGFIVDKVGHRAKHDPSSSSEPAYADRTGFIQKVVTVTRPAPVFRFLDETSRDWIAVHVLQLFDSFVVSEDIEIVVEDVPEGFRAETL
jgi:hypothetical protein